MGQRQSQEEIDRQKEKLSFQYKISGIYNKSLGGETEMTVDSLANIFGNKPLFNEGLCLLLCPSRYSFGRAYFWNFQSIQQRMIYEMK